MKKGVLLVLRLYLLGQDAVVLDEGEEGRVVVLSLGARRLLAYLCLHLDALPLSKEQIASALWPDCTTDQARANVRKFFTILRQTHPTLRDTFTVAGQYVAWYRKDGLWSDVGEFFKTYQQGTAVGWMRAVRCYRGDLLPGWEDEWLPPVRQRLRQQYLESLEQAVHAALRQGRPHQAVAFAQQWQQADPFDESALRTLMTTFFTVGNLAAALETFEMAQALWEQELGASLSVDTLKLVDQIRRGLDSSTRNPAILPLSIEREKERTIFREVVLFGTAEFLPILLLTGPGGSGKTWLLQAFAEEARTAGKQCLYIDATAVGGSVELFLAQCGRGTVNQVLGRLNRRHAMVFIDSVESLGPVREFLQTEWIPALGPTVAVVLAGRFSAIPSEGLRWLNTPKPVRVLQVGAFSRKEAYEYLSHRGVEDESTRVRLCVISGRHPLALSLATDLAIEYGVSAGELEGWVSMVHKLAEYLLREADGDEALLTALMASTVAHHVNADLVEFIIPRREATRVWERLVRLSVVRATPEGITLHEDVRHLLAQDFQWAQPARWRRLQRLILQYFWEEVVAVHDATERGRWVEELLYAAHHALLHALLFPMGEEGVMWLDDARWEDWPRIQQLWHDWLREQRFGEMVFEQQEAFDQCLGKPWFRLRVVRRDDGEIVGFDGHIPLFQGSLETLRKSPQTAKIVEYVLKSSLPLELPDDVQEATTWILRFAVFRPDAYHQARSLLLRDLLSVFVRNQRYLATTHLAESKRFFLTLGFHPVPTACWTAPLGDSLFETFELDLSGSRLHFSNWTSEVLDRVRG